MYSTKLERNADCRTLKHERETESVREAENKGKRKKGRGLEYMFFLRVTTFFWYIKKEIQPMSTHRIQTENLHFKANGNWLMYSLWRLVTWPIFAKVYFQIQSCIMKASSCRLNEEWLAQHMWWHQIWPESKDESCVCVFVRAKNIFIKSSVVQVK